MPLLSSNVHCTVSQMPVLSTTKHHWANCTLSQKLLLGGTVQIVLHIVLSQVQYQHLARCNISTLQILSSPVENISQFKF